MRPAFLKCLCVAFLGAVAFGQQPAPPADQPMPPFRFRYMGPESAGRISAVAGVPGNTNIYYAGAASGGIWKTTDGGRTFEPVFDDQPVQAIGALAVAASDPNIVWAGTGEAWAIRDSDVMGDGVYKSIDAGKTWKNMGLIETGRIGRVVIHPTNPSIVYVCALGRATGPQQERGVFKTTDGGQTWQRSLMADVNTGCSGLTLDARDPNVLFAGMWQVEMKTWAEASGGPGSAVYMTRDGGGTWRKLENGLPKSPLGKIDVAIAPSNSQRVYALIQTADQGSLWRSDDGGAAWRVVSWDRTLIGRAGYYIRVDVNPQNADEVLVANSSFHRSLDGGLNFTINGGGGCGDCHDIWMDPKSPDHWVATGDGGMGITTDHGRTFTQIVGKIWNTKDGGATWNDVTKNISGLPPWGTVRKIEPSHFDPGTAYVAVDFHLVDNRDPFIYKTSDFGQTWKKISDGLPASRPLAYAMSVAENPNRRGMLFAGTGNGFFYSLDDGAKWTAFKEGLPAAPVTWIVVSKPFHDVVVSTYGRGLFILHDITRLEQSDQVTTDADAFLYAPRPGFRQARAGAVDFLYSLKSAAATPPSLEILDAGGAVIRTIRGSSRAGLNRASWDLRYEAPRTVALRTTPPDNPHIWDEPRFKGKDTRPILHWGIEQAQFAAPIAAPGKYTARLTVNGRSLTRPIEVLKDPAIPSSDEDLAASTRAQIRIRADITATSAMVNGIEELRKQIEDQLARNKGKAAAEKALGDLEKKLLAVELRMLSRTDLHSDDKWYVEAYKIYMNLIWLNGVVGSGAGDVAGGAEYRPTDASLQVLEMIEKDLAAAKAEYAAVIEKDVQAFNRSASANGLAPLTVSVTR